MEWWGERIGPITIAAAAFGVFVIATASLVWAFPIKRLDPAVYALFAFGSLLFMVAGFYLPRLMKLKVGGLELEKSPVDVVSTTTSLGIT